MATTRSQTRRFLDLPRELRDDVYKYCYQVTPHTYGALLGYADVPSSALLRTCKQVYQEAAPIFHAGLKAAILHDRVCIKLPNDSERTVRHAGWQMLNNRRFDIWVRNGPDDATEVGWLVYLTPIWQGGVQDTNLEQFSAEILTLSTKLHDLYNLFQAEKRKKPSPVEKRLYSLLSRVSQVAKRRCGCRRPATLACAWRASRS